MQMFSGCLERETVPDPTRNQNSFVTSIQWCWGAPTDPNSVGVGISGIKAIFAECHGFEHVLTSIMPIYPRTII